MITNLIPTTEFVLLVQKEVGLRQSKLRDDDGEGCLMWCTWGYEQICNYVNFISQTPQLWMFVPCDENGVELEEPKNYEKYLVWCKSSPGNGYSIPKCIEYQLAMNKVLFSDWTYDGVGVIKNNNPDTWIGLKGYDTVEEMIMEFNQSEIEVELTETAIKQFEL